MLRIATAVVLAPLLWAVLKHAPAIVFFLLAVGFIGAATWECYKMLEAGGARPFKGLGVVATFAVVWSFAGVDPRWDLQLPLVAALALTFVVAIWRRRDPADMLETSLNTLLPIVFVGVGLGYLVGLRAAPGEDGKDLLLLLFLCVMLADTVAFYVGSTFGRHRMAPRISPKKSWEGAAGGLLGSALGAIVAHLWFYQRLPLDHALILGVVLGIAAIFGDLAESTVKRAVGVKDSSGLLPGHGGLLDRTDSLLFAGPLLYYYYRFFLQGTA